MNTFTPAHFPRVEGATSLASIDAVALKVCAGQASAEAS